MGIAYFCKAFYFCIEIGKGERTILVFQFLVFLSYYLLSLNLYHMNRFFLFFVLAAALLAAPKATIAQENATVEGKKASVVDLKSCTPEAVLTDGMFLLNKEVEISGTVTHVCHNAGRKCFLTGMDKNKSIQVFAGGDFTAFKPELIGKSIKVKGLVKEHRIQKEAIEKQEAETEAEMAKEDCADMESCEHIMNNVKQMKQWMADNGKDYYPVYYVDGLHYDMIK